jgi:hypothetical protein
MKMKHIKTFESFSIVEKKAETKEVEKKAEKKADKKADSKEEKSDSKEEKSTISKEDEKKYLSSKQAKLPEGLKKGIIAKAKKADKK